MLVDIEQRTERQSDGRAPYEIDRVSVVLTNERGTALELPDVTVLMNGAPLTFVVVTNRLAQHVVAVDAARRLAA